MKFVSMQYRTGADVNTIRRALRTAIPKARVWDAEVTSLEERPAIGVMIEKRLSLLAGTGLVKMLVHDRGSHRDIEVVAVATTIAEGMMAGMARDTSGLRRMSDSKRLAAQVATALRSAVPDWQLVS